MEQPYGEGAASGTGPESCNWGAKAGSESVRTRRKHRVRRIGVTDRGHTDRADRGQGSAG